MAKKIFVGLPEKKQISANITDIPESPEKGFESVTITPITEQYTFTRLLYNKDTNEYLYDVIEPQLNDEQRKLVENIKIKMIEIMVERKKDATKKEKLDFLKNNFEIILNTEKIKLDAITKQKIFYYIHRDFIGYGKIDVLMIDPMIEDISCDGPKTPIYVFHRKYESTRTTMCFDTDEELNRFVVALAQKCGKEVSVATPLLDATIPDGSRLQATLAKEVTTRGSSFTIRRFKPNPLTPVDLVKSHTFSPEMMAYCWMGIQYGQSMLISGGTASGKTTTLNAILLFIPPQMKIISIEDTREINIPHENWIPGLTRSGKTEKTGEVTGEIDMFDLMRAALRQRPQYMIVGEVRGQEAYIIFQAMATGKPTYSTIHADSVQAIVNRLENPPINLPRVLVSALNTVLLQAQVKVGQKMTRRIKKIIEIVGLDPDTSELIINTIFDWNPGNDEFVYLGHSNLFEKIAYLKNITIDDAEEEFKRRTEVIRWLVKKNIDNFRDVAKIISAYYQKPDEIMKKVIE